MSDSQPDDRPDVRPDETGVVFEDADYRLAVVDLLGAIAYGELSAFERLVDDAKLAPTVRDKVEMGAMATVVCAVLDPPYEAMTLAVAGHPPPVIAAPGRRSWLAEVDAGPPIGTHLLGERRSTMIALPPNSVVAFYTDGLIERRGESLDVGFSRLREAMSLAVPEYVAREIMRHVIGDHVPQDDIALLVMRRTDPPVQSSQ